jgi:hypothetical protein
MTDETPVIPELNRRMLLRGGLVAGAGLAVAGLGTFGLSKAAEAVTFDTQPYWAFCHNCAVLWYTKNNTNGVCTYALGHGGTGHAKSPSYSYGMWYNVSGTGGPTHQPGWNWCSACQCLFYAANGNAVESVCPATAYFGGPHKTGGFAYSMLYNDGVDGSTQGNWWWCGACQALFNSNAGDGSCPAPNGGGPHVAGQTHPTIIKSLAYDVSYYSTSSP